MHYTMTGPTIPILLVTLLLRGWIQNYRANPVASWWRNEVADTNSPPTLSVDFRKGTLRYDGGLCAVGLAEPVLCY
jgi:hypothetical protein